MATSRGDTFFRKANWEQALLESQGYEEADLVSTLTARAEVERPWAQVNGGAYVQARELELINALQLVVSLSKNPETLDVADVGGNGYMAAMARQRMRFQRFQWTIFESKAVSDSYQQFESESELFWMENDEQFLIAYLTSLSCHARFTISQDPTRYCISCQQKASTYSLCGCRSWTNRKISQLFNAQSMAFTQA